MADTSETKPTAGNWTPAGTGLVLVGLVAGAIVGVTLAAKSHMPPDAVVLHATGIAVPIAVGAYCLISGRGVRLGLLLVAVGLAGVVITLAESGDATPYSIGRLAAWLIVPLLVYLILAF